MEITQRQAQSIVDEMKATIGRDINIMDKGGVILASTNSARRGKLHGGALQIIQNNLPALTVWEDDAQAGVQRGINLPVTMDGELVGVIGITGEPEQVSVFGEVIQRMTEILLGSVRRQQQLELIDRAKGLFMENWLFATELDWDELEVRGRLLGFEIGAPYTVALISLGEQDEAGPSGAEEVSEVRSGRMLRMIQEHIRDGKGHFCAALRDGVIVLLKGLPHAQAHAKISEMCREIAGCYGAPVSAGIGGASKNPADIRRCYLEARMAATVAARSHDGGRVVFYNQVSLEFIVQSIPRAMREDVREMLFSGCSVQERQEFAQTVSHYYQQDGDIQRCAQTLFVHRNTFQYRMDRLRKKTGYDLRIPKHAMLLYLAIGDEQ